MKLCSACLLGINCRYDGKAKPDKNILRLSQKEFLIPVCPEQLGNLPTPRERSEKKGRRVFNYQGIDVTQNLKNGAKAVLKLARLLEVKEAILKQRSASCGCGQIYDGTFSDRIIEGNGITTALLKKNGIRVLSEEDI